MENVFVLVSNRMIYPHFISTLITKEKQIYPFETPDKAFFKRLQTSYFIQQELIVDTEKADFKCT